MIGKRILGSIKAEEFFKTAYLLNMRVAFEIRYGYKKVISKSNDFTVCIFRGNIICSDFSIACPTRYVVCFKEEEEEEETSRRNIKKKH